MNTRDYNFLFSVTFFILIILIIILESVQFYREVKEQEHYKIGFCEGKGGKFIQNQCVDNKYIFN